MYRKISVIPYDAHWPEQFNSLAKQIKEALGPNCIEIHHIGSTAVEGLAAKPIIDIIPVVKDIVAVDQCDKAMQSLGFEVMGEAGMLFRRYFYKNENGERTVNVHTYELGSSEIERHLLFRDFLRAHPQDKEAYGALKSKLAQKHPDSIEDYLNGKGAFVASIDKQTKYKGLRLVQAFSTHEWKEYHRIRKELIFDVIGVTYNPQHPTLSDPNHRHIVLIEDTQIVGGIHLEFLDSKTVAIRPFAIDTPYQNRGLGSFFIKQIEKWLIQQNIELVQLHANPEAVNFYRRLGYIEMLFIEPNKAAPSVSIIDLGKKL